MSGIIRVGAEEKSSSRIVSLNQKKPTAAESKEAVFYADPVMKIVSFLNNFEILNFAAVNKELKKQVILATYDLRVGPLYNLFKENPNEAFKPFEKTLDEKRSGLNSLNSKDLTFEESEKNIYEIEKEVVRIINREELQGKSDYFIAANLKTRIQMFDQEVRVNHQTINLRQALGATPIRVLSDIVVRLSDEVDHITPLKEILSKIKEIKDTRTSNNVIRFLGRYGFFRDINNSIFSIYEKTEVGCFWQEIRKILLKPGKDLLINQVAQELNFVVLQDFFVKGYVESGHWEKALQCLCKILISQEHMFLRLAEKCKNFMRVGNIRVGLAICKIVPPGLRYFSFNEREIKACLEAEELDLAYKIFSESSVNSKEIYTKIMDKFLEAKEFCLALKFILKQSFHFSETFFKKLLTTFIKAGRVDCACELLLNGDRSLCAGDSVINLIYALMFIENYQDAFKISKEVLRNLGSVNPGISEKKKELVEVFVNFNQFDLAFEIMNYNSYYNHDNLDSLSVFLCEKFIDNKDFNKARKLAVLIKKDESKREGFFQRIQELSKESEEEKKVDESGLNLSKSVKNSSAEVVEDEKSREDSLTTVYREFAKDNPDYSEVEKVAKEFIQARQVETAFAICDMMPYRKLNTFGKKEFNRFLEAEEFALAYKIFDRISINEQDDKFYEQAIKKILEANELTIASKFALKVLPLLSKSFREELLIDFIKAGNLDCAYQLFFKDKELCSKNKFIINLVHAFIHVNNYQDALKISNEICRRCDKEIFSKELQEIVRRFISVKKSEEAFSLINARVKNRCDLTDNLIKLVTESFVNSKELDKAKKLASLLLDDNLRKEFIKKIDFAENPIKLEEDEKVQQKETIIPKSESPKGTENLSPVEVSQGIENSEEKNVVTTKVSQVSKEMPKSESPKGTENLSPVEVSQGVQLSEVSWLGRVYLQLESLVSAIINFFSRLIYRSN